MISVKNSRILRCIAIIIVMISHYASWMYVEAANEILRYRISTWGPFGVDIFFLLSGYGLYMSALKRKTGITFFLKRLAVVYVPYLLIAGIIMLINGQWENINLTEIREFITGFNYWYITVLLVFYISFSIIWRFIRPNELRILAITVVTAAYSFFMHRLGRHDFWIVSNFAFIIGVVAAFAENKIKDICYKKENAEGVKNKRVRISVALLMTVGLIGVVACDTVFWMIWTDNPLGGFMWKVLTNVFFAVFMLGLAYMMSIIMLPKGGANNLPTSSKRFNFKGIMAFLLDIIGRDSLYIYLIHQTLFWIILPHLVGLGYVLASIITAIISIAFCCLVAMVFNRFICDKLVSLLDAADRKAAEKRNPAER